MEIKDIYNTELGIKLKARVFHSPEIKSNTEKDIKDFFDAQKTEGWVFYSSYRKNDLVTLNFVKETDLPKEIIDRQPI
jgi:hypothetical protein